MTVSIIIPNWNGRELLEKNLPTVLKAAQNSKNSIEEIVVVDDKSTDDSVSFLETNFKDQVKIVRHKENRGFSAAVNTGVRTARGKLVCLLNTDVVPESDFLVMVLPHFEQKEVFGVSLHEKGYGFAKGRFVDGFITHAPGPEAKDTRETFWANGGSGVFRRNLWMKLKGMDEQILSPLYWEDIDLCYRAAKRGYRLLWEPGARILHEHEVTVRKLNQKWLKRIQERNQLLFIWKNLTSPILFKKHLRGLVSRLVKHPGYLVVLLAALAKIVPTLKARQKEKKASKVSDEAIFAKFNA